MKPLLIVGIAVVIAGGAPAQEPKEAAPLSSCPWMDRSLAPEQRARLLVARMTLDEKVLEIHMMDVKAHPREVPGVARLGIPVFKITNGPLGAGPGDSRKPQPATALPAALALAASWDTGLAERFGAIAGAETADRGEDLIEAPGVNIARVPQNGRNFEYFGEDPWLAGRMAVAEIRGIQGQGVIAEVKHFAANSQEHDRKTIDEVIDERTLREIYLPAFEAAVKEGGAGAVMAAYPSVNGQFCCENVHLLRDILRGEWGFGGFVQSDYTATKSAVRSARAGLDLSMKFDHYGAEMKAAVDDGKVPEAAVDAMLVRRFAVMFRFGLFDHARTPRAIPARRDGRVARMIATQSAVLLKDEGGLLPLGPGVRSIAVIGPYAAAAMTGGSGSSAVKPLYTVAPLDGIRRRAGPGVAVSFEDGTDLQAAAAAARSTDVAIVMVGNKDGEGRDRPSLRLPGSQDALVEAVAAANPRTIVILKTGGAVLMPWIGKVPAVLEAWYPGEEDGDALADVVFGDVDPSGRLPLSFPKAGTEVPASTPEQYPGVNGTAVYSERLLVGYRWYDARGVAPLFPFGYGMSYTSFAISKLGVSTYTEGRPLSVSADVANTGRREGAEVVQVYVSDPLSAGEPPRQLRGFAKVALAPGEMRRVTIAIDPRAFSIWNVREGRWTVVSGGYRILVGDSSRMLPLSAQVEVPSGG